MSAQHRKPIVAFVVLALAVVALIGAQRAEAQHGRILATGIGADVEVRGQLPASTGAQRAASQRAVAVGPAVAALADRTGVADDLLASGSGSLVTTPAALERRVAKGAASVRQGVRHSPRAVEARAQRATTPGAGAPARTVRADQRGAQRDAARHRAPRGARPGRGR